MSDLIKKDNQSIIEKQVQNVTNFLEELGLPSDNIIAAYDERKIIGDNLPNYLINLPSEVKQDARYLSKFVVGAGFGLFDYALNSVWNEVTISLRTKAITYGLDIFYDAAVGGNLREAYKKEEDLAGLKDKVLLNTCRKLELIAPTTYKKLAHILDMRNDIGISHPTNYSINAFELLGWLQTCIQDVIQDKPSEAAIQVKAFIDNLKNLTDTLDTPTINTIKPQIQSLASHHCNNILRTIFGVYVATNTNQILRKNISLLAPIVWETATDDMKYKLGVIIEGYNNNLHKDKFKRGVEFFTFCKGNKYRTKSERIVALDNLANRLRNAHQGWNNFYNEVPIIIRILTFIDSSADIPNEIAGNLIKAILQCGVGNGVNYNNGVSPSGQEYYHQFFQILGEEYIPTLIVQLTKFDIQQSISRKNTRKQCVKILEIVKNNVVNDRYNECLQYLIDNLHKHERVIFDTKFKELSKGFIKWK